jgi:GTPase SAR1 family protein
MMESKDKLHAGLGDPVLLDKIDQLLACNVGEHISLPQLVVVGDQSSGKSSVLEALTKLPFPRDSGLCTRFATQIVFRRSSGTRGRRITISINPSAQGDAARIAQLQEWKTADVENLDSTSFSRIMSEVRYSCQY